MSIDGQPPVPPTPPVPPVPPAGPPADGYDPYAAKPPAASPYAANPYAAQPPVPGAPGAPGEKTNVLAIVSLVASILGFFTGILAIVGVICGHISLSQIKKTAEKGRGFAIAGLIVGYVAILTSIIAVIAIIAIFAATASATNEFQSQIDSLASSSPFVEESDIPTPDDSASISTLEDCTVLESALLSATTDVNDAFAQFADDPDAAVAGLQGVADDIDTALAQVNDPNVLSAGLKANGDLKDLIAAIQAYQADPSVGTDAITAAGDAAETDFTAIDTACS